LKHGLLHRKDNRKLWIRLRQSEDSNRLVVEIEDNGIGRKRAAEIKSADSTHKSFSTSATRKRLELLNAERKEKIGLEIVDLMGEDGEATGTMVKLRIPMG
jgi:two-component sensor histidine kinase